MSTPLTGEVFEIRKSTGIEKVAYTHDAMIDLILRKPMVSHAEISLYFGYTRPWISRVIASDAFQARLAERKTELIDPGILASVEENFKSLILESQRVLLARLTSDSVQTKEAVALLGVASKAAGYGARQTNVQVNNQFIVHVPEKAKSSQEWEEGRVLESTHVPSPT